MRRRSATLLTAVLAGVVMMGTPMMASAAESAAWPWDPESYGSDTLLAGTQIRVSDGVYAFLGCTNAGDNLGGAIYEVDGLCDLIVLIPNDVTSRQFTITHGELLAALHREGRTDTRIVTRQVAGAGVTLSEENLTYSFEGDQSSWSKGFYGFDGDVSDLRTQLRVVTPPRAIANKPTASPYSTTVAVGTQVIVSTSALIETATWSYFDPRDPKAVLTGDASMLTVLISGTIDDGDNSIFALERDRRPTFSEDYQTMFWTPTEPGIYSFRYSLGLTGESWLDYDPSPFITNGTITVTAPESVPPVEMVEAAEPNTKGTGPQRLAETGADVGIVVVASILTAIGVLAKLIARRKSAQDIAQ